MQVTAAFDGGNIRVVDASSANDIRLEIKPDAETDLYQWFYFRVVGARDCPLQMHILNAGHAYVDSWEDYQAVVSTDRRKWIRTTTKYANGVLTISHSPSSNSIYVAFFAPYSLERHADLIARALDTGLADLEILGQSIDARNLDLLTIGEPAEEKLTFWVTARQHPGETMAEWWVEGFLDRLLDATDKTARRLRQNVAFFIVPNMNPDGSHRGYLRTNAAGIDLNRAWKAPNPKLSPEVYFTRHRMFKSEPDLILDIHGTEDIRHAFIVGPEGAAGSREPVKSLVREYKQALLEVNRDFQTVAGFDTDHDAVVDALATNYQGETLGCLCITLEMPFKDTTHTPDEIFGWSPQRSMKMGRDNVTAMAAMVDRIKQERKAWQ